VGKLTYTYKKENVGSYFSHKDTVWRIIFRENTDKVYKDVVLKKIQLLIVENFFVVGRLQKDAESVDAFPFRNMGRGI
jgi:hypothetical protein